MSAPSSPVTIALGEAIVTDRNRAQKHVLRARIVIHSADRLSVAEVARPASKAA